MTSLRNCIVFSCLSLVGTVGLVAFSDPAMADPVEAVRQASVVTADLNLGNAAGRATFERRAAAAAQTVCAETSPTRVGVETSCRKAALKQARRDAGIGDTATN